MLCFKKRLVIGKGKEGIQYRLQLPIEIKSEIRKEERKRFVT